MVHGSRSGGGSGSGGSGNGTNSPSYYRIPSLLPFDVASALLALAATGRSKRNHRHVNNNGVPSLKKRLWESTTPMLSHEQARPKSASTIER